jgi:hypothetical protein
LSLYKSGKEVTGLGQFTFLEHLLSVVDDWEQLFFEHVDVIEGFSLRGKWPHPDRLREQNELGAENSLHTGSLDVNYSLEKSKLLNFPLDLVREHHLVDILYLAESACNNNFTSKLILK